MSDSTEDVPWSPMDPTEILSDGRDAITSVYARMLRLLPEQAWIAEDIGAAKEQLGLPVENLEREAEALTSLQSLAEEEGLGIDPDDIAELYSFLAGRAKRIQHAARIGVGAELEAEKIEKYPILGVTSVDDWLGLEHFISFSAIRGFDPRTGTAAHRMLTVPLRRGAKRWQEFDALRVDPRSLSLMTATREEAGIGALPTSFQPQTSNVSASVYRNFPEVSEQAVLAGSLADFWRDHRTARIKNLAGTNAQHYMSALLEYLRQNVPGFNERLDSTDPIAIAN